MAKLYPPYVNGTIPAFYYTKGATIIVVPFTMNKAVSVGEVAGFALKIKTITGDVKTVETMVSNFDIFNSNASVTFLSKENFLVGQFYKVQLAYIDQAGVIGYYSTVSVIKCTTKPNVTIDGLDYMKPNLHQHSYTGVYSQYGGDVTEKMYSYRFLLTDNQDNIIYDSGERIHNNSLDNLPYESHADFLVRQDLSQTNAYYLQFIVTTVNKLTIRSQRYRIVERQLVPPEVVVDLMAEVNFNNGYTKISMHSKDDVSVSGNFVLSRANSKDGFLWEEIKRFDLFGEDPNFWSFKDFTVEQGIKYKYAIQQYNANGVYSDKIVSNEVMVDFEDMFLSDGQRQLKIRYNPKVSSFKTTLLEAKMDTIGSKYPYFSRNGRVEYKEFAISGLISYFVDEEEIFMPVAEIGLDTFIDRRDPYAKQKTTNLLDYNIAAERMFKNEVLDWLNDGKVKLFRSPAEGNYLVRLMNVSLTPMDQLSRMLHTFSATAYEIAPCDSEGLIYYGFINPAEILMTQLKWATVDIQTAVQEYLDKNNKKLKDAIGDSIILTKQPAQVIDIRDAKPGSYFYVNTESIQIGKTGSYHYESSDENAIGVVNYIIDTVNIGQIDYSYATQIVSLFNLVQETELADIPARQFVGKDYLSDALVWDSANHVFTQSSNLLDAIRDTRIILTSLNSIKAEKRPVDIVYLPHFNSYEEEQAFLRGEIEYTNVITYTDEYCTQLFDWSKADPMAIYRFRFEVLDDPYNTIRNYKYYVDANYDEFAELTNVCVDGKTKDTFLYTDDIFTMTINEEPINLNETEKFIWYNSKAPMDIINIELHSGILLDVSYSSHVKVFNVENEPDKYIALNNAKFVYEKELEAMYAARAEGIKYNFDILKLKYRQYIHELNLALDDYEEENNIV